MVKVSVYIPCHNYGHYVDQAVKSIFNQIFTDWELIIINDGSTDQTIEIIDKYRNDKRVTIIDQEKKGLNITNNIALRLASGKYIMRLDADDYLDENALLVLSSVLDSKPDIGLVYPDYYHVDEEGEVIEHIRRKKLFEEVELLDLPAHGACTMFRKEILLELGGYCEDFSCQDGYEIWLRFIDRNRPYNVNVPLFYYRQHSVSLTKDNNRILETRRAIKKRYVDQKRKERQPRVLGIIPAARHGVQGPGDPLLELGGNTLIHWTIEEACKAKSLDRIILSSDDPKVLAMVEGYPRIKAVKRDPQLSLTTVRMQVLINAILDKLEIEEGYRPEAVCTLYINTPFRRSEHIDKAVDTMEIFNVDSVLSVNEELAKCYFHRQHGLEPVNNENGILRLERNSIFKENSAIFLSKTEVIRNGNLIGRKVGHIIMLAEESIKINSRFEYWLARKLVEDGMTRRTLHGVTNN
jgi:CMP-N-acetylneuraminic acid synthetase